MLQMTENQKKKKGDEGEAEKRELRRRKRLLGERNKKVFGGWVHENRYRIGLCFFFFLLNVLLIFCWLLIYSDNLFLKSGKNSTSNCQRFNVATRTNLLYYIHWFISFLLLFLFLLIKKKKIVFIISLVFSHHFLINLFIIR